jgi:hypothetical protein
MRAVLIRQESFISIQIHRTCVLREQLYVVLCLTIYLNMLPLFIQYTQDAVNFILPTEQVNVVVADLLFERDPLLQSVSNIFVPATAASDQSGHKDV